MSRSTLTFKLPEQEQEFLDAFFGGAYKACLDDMDNYLRGRIKYEDLNNDQRDALQAARDYLKSVIDARISV